MAACPGRSPALGMRASALAASRRLAERRGSPRRTVRNSCPTAPVTPTTAMRGPFAVFAARTTTERAREAPARGRCVWRATCMGSGGDVVAAPLWIGTKRLPLEMHPNHFDARQWVGLAARSRELVAERRHRFSAPPPQHAPSDATVTCLSRGCNASHEGCSGGMVLVPPCNSLARCLHESGDAAQGPHYCMYTSSSRRLSPGSCRWAGAGNQAQRGTP